MAPIFVAEVSPVELHRVHDPKTGSRVLVKSRLGHEALGDISNLDEHGDIVDSNDRRRMYSLGNRLWHTDASFQDPPGRYSMLHARVIPPVGADTEFADERAAYDALPAGMRERLEGLRVHHSIAHSRQILGFEFSNDEENALRGAIHPLIRTVPRSNRKSLDVASHAGRSSSHVLNQSAPSASSAAAAMSSWPRVVGWIPSQNR